MLTRTGEHALRAVIYLARQPDGRPVSAENVARALGAPANYLAKTLAALAAAGIVRGRRGPRGGYRLLIPANRLTIADVTAPFEPEHGIAACLMGGRACDPKNPCEAHFRWVGVREAAAEPLRTTTIAELLGEAAAVSPDESDESEALAASGSGAQASRRVGTEADADAAEAGEVDGLIQLLYLS